MPELIITKPLRFAGKQREAGDRIDANPRDARLLLAIKKARLPGPDDTTPPSTGTTEPSGQQKAMDAETPPAVTRRTYQRRDIAAASETKADAPPQRRGRRTSASST